MMVGKSKKRAFTLYVERIRSRLDNWNLRFLSMGGKETLIKTILQALPVYAMQCLLLTKMLCSKLENVLNSLWWRN